MDIAEQLREWRSKGGKSRTAAQTAARRQNGRKGGRPVKCLGGADRVGVRERATVHAEADGRCGRVWLCTCAACRMTRNCTCVACRIARRRIARIQPENQQGDQVTTPAAPTQEG